MLERREIKIGNIPYAAGAIGYRPIPLDYPLIGLALRLDGRLVISAGTTSGTPWSENPMSLIERIRVYGSKQGGAVEIVNLAAAEIYALAHIFGGVAGDITAVADGADATTDFLADIFLPLSIPRTVEEAVMGSLLPAYWFDDLQLEIKFRDGTLTTIGGLISGGDRTLALTAYGSGSGVPNVSIVGIQVDNIDTQIHNPVLHKMYKKSLVTEVVESARKEPLNRGGFYRALILKAFADTGARVPSDTLITNSKLLVSGNAKRDWPWRQLRSQNKAEYELESMPTGYGVFDFTPNGDPSTMLDTTRYAQRGISLEMELALAGSADDRVDVITLEAVPPGQW